MGTLNFDNLPKNNPFGKVDEGFYKGVVKNTEVKQDTKGQDFIAITFNLFKPDGKPAGIFTDKIYGGDSPVLMYKVGRMMQAMGINLSGNMDFKMIAKLIAVGKEVAMEIADNEYKGVVRSQIKIFDSQCYWPVSMLPGLVAAYAEAHPEQGKVNAAVREAVIAADAEMPVPWDDNAIAPIPAPAATAGNFEFNAADGAVPPPVAQQPTPVTENAAGVTEDNY